MLRFCSDQGNIMFNHLQNPEACPFGAGETVREVNSRKTAAERAAIDAEADAVFAAAEAAAVDRAAKLAADPFVRGDEWDQARKAYGHDIRDADGVPVAVVAAYVWREAAGVRTIEAQILGSFVSTRGGIAPAEGPLVNASAGSIDWDFGLRYSTPSSAASDWLPASAYEPKSAYEPHVNALWIDLLGDAADAIELRQWEVVRAAKAAKAAKPQKTTAVKSANPFAALAALKA